MKRCAILLATISEDKTASAGGVIPIRKFLMSSLGGAWREDEIVCAYVETRSDVLGAVSKARTSDFSIVYVHGRGETKRRDLPWPETRIDLPSRESASERDLNPGTPRCSLILDCTGATAEAAVVSEYHGANTSEWSRCAFETALEAAELGLVTVRATALQNPRGATFAHHLVKAAEAWAKDHGGGLHYSDAVKSAKQTFVDDVPDGVAEYKGGRRLVDFPLAVNKSV